MTIKKVELKSGETRYRFVIDFGKKPDGKRDQRTFTYLTLKEARAEHGRIVADRAKGTLVMTSKATVAQLCETWLNGKRNLSPGTRRTYVDGLKRITDRVGHVKAAELTKAHLDETVTHLLDAGRRIGNRTRKGISARSVNLTITLIRAVLEDAVKQGTLGRNVAKLVEKPEQYTAEMKTWTAAQAAAFLASIAGDRLNAAWQLTSYGLRRGEVLGLRWSDVDLVGKTITVRWARTSVAGVAVEKTPKTERGTRELPLDDDLVNALMALQLRQRDEREAAGDAYAQACALVDPKTGVRCTGDHVVVDELGHTYQPVWYGHRFEALTKAAKLPVIRLHDVRHTCASVMHARGVPIADISKWLGHSKASFTYDTYVKSQAGALAPAGAMLKAALTAA